MQGARQPVPKSNPHDWTTSAMRFRNPEIAAVLLDHVNFCGRGTTDLQRQQRAEGDRQFSEIIDVRGSEAKPLQRRGDG
jgi:hypothetical protein